MRLFALFLLFLSSGAFASSIAIVTHDRVPLRSAPGGRAQAHAILLQGEAVEVRGERLDYLQVWDYRRERGGFVRASQVRRLALTPEEAPELLAVVRFLLPSAGSDALGIALATLYLQVAPAEDRTGASSIAEGIEALDAVGTFAERLAQRAVPEQLEAVARYGVRFTSVEREGRMRVCYDGEAFRRVLALPSAAAQRARAALALTRPECIPDALPVVERVRLDAWRAEVLDRVEVKDLPPYLRNRIAVRRAGIWAALAFHRARGLGEEGELAAPAAQRALAELKSIDKHHLVEGDKGSYNDAVRRVQASRWAAVEPAVPSAKAPRLVTSHGKPGETCVALVDGKAAAKRCTYGVVWPGSARLNHDASAMSVAVQLTETFQETWRFRRTRAGWAVSVIPPSSVARP